MGFLAWVRKKSVRGITLEDAITQCIEAKRFANRRERYIVTLRQYLRAFSRGREHALLSEIANVETLDKWFSSRSEAPSTRAANTGRLSALFAFAHRRGWITENPCFRLEKVSVEKSAPAILTVEQSEKLLRWCVSRKPVALAFLSLTLFAGLRPEETRGVSWDDIGPDFVTVSAKTTKVRRRRIVHPEPIAHRWLEKARVLNATLPVSRTTHRRYIKAFREALGFNHWPQDILRHTCASMWLAKTQDAGKVAYELGNSPAVLLRHYRELVHKDVAEAFWKLTP